MGRARRVRDPWVDAYSVWRGPTSTSSTTTRASSPPSRSRSRSRRRDHLGLPDLFFFSLFLGAALRFGLRVLLTWLSLSLSFGATMALAIWCGLGGLPALPLLAVGFLRPNADLLWRRLRRARRTQVAVDDASRSSSATRLDVRRVREHVHRPRPDEPVAVVVARAASRRPRASSGCTRRRRSAARRARRAAERLPASPARGGSTTTTSGSPARSRSSRSDLADVPREERRVRRSSSARRSRSRTRPTPRRSRPPTPSSRRGRARARSCRCRSRGRRPSRRR